jgi:branched-chain amino acid transport system permease protein
VPWDRRIMIETSILKGKNGNGNILGVVFIVVGFGILMPLIGIRHTTDFMIFCIYALAFTILYGFLGRLSFGHMLYFGVGGYSAALFARHFSADPIYAMLIGICSGILIGLLLGPIIVRTTGACFALTNLAFNEVGYFLALVAFDKYTGGEDGLPVSYLKLGFIDINNQYVILAFVAICLLGSFVILKLVTSSPYGVLIRSINENENRVQFLGYNTFGVKLVTFCISTALTALAGFLTTLNYGYMTTGYIDPLRNVEVIFAVLIGGSKSLYGAIIGGVLYMIITNYLAIYIARWEMFLGIVLLIISLKFRKGIWGYIEDISARQVQKVKMTEL